MISMRNSSNDRFKSDFSVQKGAEFDKLKNGLWLVFAQVFVFVSIVGQDEYMPLCSK